MGFRVPSALTPPASFSDAGSLMTFTRMPTYDAQLISWNPPGAGYTWYGYTSAAYSGSYATATVVYDVPFGVPQQAGGAALASPLDYQVVEGAQLSATPAITCNFSAYELCVAASATSTPADANSRILTDQTAHMSAATFRDLGMSGTTTASVAAGGSTTVPFSTRFNGPVLPAGESFAMSASSNGPGFSVTPSSSTWVPAANSTATFNANVTVPGGTAAGTYNVTLTATGSGGGAVRTATSTVTVTSDTTAPTPNPMTATAVANSPSQVTVTAALATDDNALHATPYSVDSGTASWQSSRTFVKSGLAVANTQYTWTVRARDAAGNASTGTVSRRTLSNPPTGVAFTASDWTSANQNRLTLGWTTPTGGATSYVVRTSPGNAVVTSTSASSATFSGLAGNVSLTYKVCSVNGDGVEETVCSTAVTGTTPPDGPASASTASITTTGATYTWSSVAGATKYRLNITTGATCGTAVSSVSSIATTSYALNSLQVDREYTYTLNSYGGTGAYGAPSSCGQLSSTNDRTAIAVSVDSASRNLGTGAPGAALTAASVITVTTAMTSTFELHAQLDHLPQTGGYTIPAVTNGGTVATPLAWGAATGFGITMSGATANAKWSNGTKYAPISTSDSTLNATTGLNPDFATDEVTSLNVGYRITAPSTQFVGTYAATVTYTIVPTA
jgi:hypothetical protein